MKPEIKLKKLCDAQGIELEHKGNGHYHIKGKLLVNYWPNSAKQTCYVANTTAGKQRCTPEQAVAMSQTQPEAQGRKDKRKANYGKLKRRLYKKSQCCMWCEEEFKLKDLTIEHIIPLHIGGLDNPNNYGLACEPCNTKRGCDMPELKQ